MINNILFVHFTDSVAHDAYQPAIPVPYEIYKRLYSYGNIAIISTYYNDSNSSTIPIYISNSSGKPYITFSRNTSAEENKKISLLFLFT